MTMPVERARSLRWGWEFLWELQTAANLTPEQLTNVRDTLRHYPSTSEIEAWASEKDKDGLEAEDYGISKPQLGIPLSVDRGPTSAQERYQALVSAFELFNFDLLHSNNLTPDQRRTLTAVLRHFPNRRGLEWIAGLELCGQPVGSSSKIWLELKDSYDPAS